MKRALVVMALAISLILFRCSTSERSPAVAQDVSRARCRCTYKAPCPDLEAEMDRITPGCLIPPEALPQPPERRPRKLMRAEIKDAHAQQ